MGDPRRIRLQRTRWVLLVHNLALVTAWVPMTMTHAALGQSTGSDSDAQSMGSSNAQSARTAPPSETPTDAPSEVLAVKLELDLPSGCGSLNDFVDRLRARLERIQFSEIGANRVVQARIEATSDDRYRATMTLRYPDGHSSSRIVDANSCDDALEALALITAVTLDPLAVSSTEARSKEQPRAEQPREQAPQRTVANATSANTADGSATSNPKPAIQRTADTRRTDDQTNFGLGVAYTAFRGLAPGTLNGIDVNLSMGQRSRRPLALSARLGLSYAVNAGVIAQGGIADFSLASVVLDLCPLQHLSAIVELRACGLVHAGLITAEGRATEDPESHRRPILAFGSSLQLTWVAWDFLALPLRAHLAFPTSHDTFGFYPVAFYQIPAMSYNVTAGLEARFR